MAPKWVGHLPHSTTLGTRNPPSEGSLRNGSLNSKDWPNITHLKKLIALYGEGGTAIGSSWTLVLDVTVRDKVLVNNLTTEDVQTGFNNGHAVDNQLERSSNVTNKEETMKIYPIP